MQEKGFTLLELLIVIAILAILSTAIVVYLNPAQLLAETRDSQRINDLGSIQSAISLYLTNTTNPTISFRGSCSAQCFTHAVTVTNAGCAGGGLPRHSATIGGSGTKNATASSTASRSVDGLGWVPVDFGTMTGGSPFATLPVDPSNTDTYFYSYACSENAKTFELNANMESARYSESGTGDVEANDGGDITSVYEVGNDPGLNQ